MTTTIVFARGGADAGSVSSSAASFSSALSGANLQQDADAQRAYVGLALVNVYHVHQWGNLYSYVADSNSTPAAAYFRWWQDYNSGTGVPRILEVVAYNWGSTYGPEDFRTPAQLQSLANAGNRLAQINHSNQTGLGRLRAGLEQMDRISGSVALRVVLFTNRNRTQSAPTDREYHRLRTSNFAGTAYDPALFVAETTRHLADVTLGGQVQLSDGTHAYLRQDSPAPNVVNLSVVWTNGGSSSTVHTAPIGDDRGGAQTYTLVRDAADNLYILNGNPAYPGMLRARALVKGAGHNWTARPVHNLPLPAYQGNVNNVAAAWHPQGGGTIVALVARNAGRNSGVHTAYMLINAGYLLGQGGSAVRGSGTAEGVLIGNPAPDGSHNYVNETGSLLDVAAAPGSGRGYVISTTKAQPLGDRGAQSVAYYELNSAGTGFAVTGRLIDTNTGYATKDADAKSRVIGIDGSQFVSVTADPAVDRGITVVHRQAIGNSGLMGTLSDVRLGAEDIPSMPAPQVLATSPAWDAIYSPTDNRLWVYFFDQADPRRLLRTHVNLSTGQAGRDEVEVAAAVGAVGSTNLAVRVHRGAGAGAEVLVTVTNRTSGGAHQFLTVSDMLNWPPTQPTIVPKSNFDATAPTDFQWVFNDPNPQDQQSAFHLEIYNSTTGTLVHDTGKTASTTTSYTLPAGTLTNGQQYRWRVRTWDDLDEQSPWSEYGTFVTSESGTVTIIDPAVDNDPEIITSSYLLEWEVDGTTQADYRVVARRTDTGAVLVDTGWVASTDTTYLLQGMEPGVEYQVEVTARNASQVETNTAVRLITPDFAAPEKPLIAVEPVHDGGYVLVTVINPPPAGDRPLPVGNEIYRRRAGTGEPWVLLAEIEPDGTYRDYTAPSGVPLEYMARAGVIE